VFSNQFLIAQLNKMIHAETLESMRASKEILANIVVPLVQACKLLERPPILSYNGYALYNWRRFQTDRPIELGNLDTVQNFVHL
jgi:indoleamine 2,3-dioxygenase